MSSWRAYDHGRTIGTVSAEGGTVILDEVTDSGARITLKRGDNYFLVSMQIFGWMDHTRFFSTDNDAQREYRAMRSGVSTVLNVINTKGVNEIKVWEVISEFVRRFP